MRFQLWGSAQRLHRAERLQRGGQERVLKKARRRVRCKATGFPEEEEGQGGGGRGRGRGREEKEAHRPLVYVLRS